MIRLNVHQAKTHLSKYLDRIIAGEVVVLCRRNVPVAEIRALPVVRIERRPSGIAQGEFEVPADFNDPLPDEIVNAFWDPA